LVIGRAPRRRTTLTLAAAWHSFAAGSAANEFLDLGQAGGAGRLRASAGPGLRASWKGFDLMGFAADALSRPAGGRTRCCLMGFSLTYTLTAL
jgi:hypothetical protein